ncbi:biotin synthase [Thermococcus sp. CX2]|uniref:DUF257 family protein n=1 Tax=Thermococcus sp. CX2 TaxID=163006 RepID=UPI00143AD8C0|nr:DUF257 family protein [Thermococcus sp. CX2]NJE85151.1 biotin synthase [Thermococcus sp. CX2]
MDTTVFETYLFGKAQKGDIVMVEYPSVYPVEEFSWGLLIPMLVDRGVVVIGDFFGVGDLMFRNYIRRISGREYSRIIEIIKKIKVVKVGPGSASYGEVIEEVVPVYDSHSFLKNYHMVVNRMANCPAKPDYVLTFGLAQYIRFGGDEAMKAILTSISTIPMEDWIGIHFVNVDILSPEHLAMLEEVSSIVFYISKEGLIIKKEGEAFATGGG